MEPEPLTPDVFESVVLPLMRGFNREVENALADLAFKMPRGRDVRFWIRTESHAGELPHVHVVFVHTQFACVQIKRSGFAFYVDAERL